MGTWCLRLIWEAGPFSWEATMISLYRWNNQRAKEGHWDPVCVCVCVCVCVHACESEREREQMNESEIKRHMWVSHVSFPGMCKRKRMSVVVFGCMNWLAGRHSPCWAPDACLCVFVCVWQNVSCQKRARVHGLPRHPSPSSWLSVKSADHHWITF